MKIAILITLILTSFLNSLAQTKDSSFTYKEFEKQLLAYEPVKNPKCTEAEFDYGTHIISETKTDIIKNNGEFNRANYFNILSAFLSLKESENSIQLAFNKFREAEGSCEFMQSYGVLIFGNPKWDSIAEKMKVFMDTCK